MGENNTLIKLLRWYDSWENKLNEYVTNKDYAKIIDIHFKTGLGLFSAMKKILKSHPEYKQELKEKYELLHNKLIIINNARKTFDNIG